MILDCIFVIVRILYIALAKPVAVVLSSPSCNSLSISASSLSSIIALIDFLDRQIYDMIHTTNLIFFWIPFNSDVF